MIFLKVYKESPRGNPAFLISKCQNFETMDLALAYARELRKKDIGYFFVAVLETGEELLLSLENPKLSAIIEGW